MDYSRMFRGEKERMCLCVQIRTCAHLHVSLCILGCFLYDYRKRPSEIIVFPINCYDSEHGDQVMFCWQLQDVTYWKLEVGHIVIYCSNSLSTIRMQKWAAFQGMAKDRSLKFVFAKWMIFHQSCFFKNLLKICPCTAMF